jgi:multicomponent Na+:H+ antiporter subunit E
VLLGFWLLLSGYFTPFLVLAGIGCSAAVAGFAHRMDVTDREGLPIYLWRTPFLYWPWLVKEIAKSAWLVTRIILHPRLPVSPTVVRFRPSQRTPVGLVTHANSITLTPGTLTIEASADEFVVHGVVRETAEGALDSEMDRRIARLEGPRGNRA